MRRALALAVEQGLDRDAAILHNNLAFATWEHEGPAAALELCGEGIEFCERRGIAGIALVVAAMRLTFLAACGRSEDALADALPLAERAQTAGDAASLIEIHSVQLGLV